jgi:hypothetical protein
VNQNTAPKCQPWRLNVYPVLFDSQYGSIGSEKSDTLQKMVAGQPEPDPQKKKSMYIQSVENE